MRDQFVHSTKFVRREHSRSLHGLRTTSARVTACSEFRDRVGVDFGGHRGVLQRLHGDAAVKVVLHSAMAAMLLALLTTRLQVAAVVFGAVLPRRGAEP